MLEGRNSAGPPRGDRLALKPKHTIGIIGEFAANLLQEQQIANPPLNLGLPMTRRRGLTPDQGGDYGPDCPPAPERQ
jgi:hypothetical protein